MPNPGLPDGEGALAGTQRLPGGCEGDGSPSEQGGDPALVTLVECADIASPDDVDTPEDLARVGALLSGPGA